VSLLSQECGSQFQKVSHPCSKCSHSCKKKKKSKKAFKFCVYIAIWMMPQDSVYGGWPTSGEMDIMEGRGNRQLISNGQNIGVELAQSTMHWGKDWSSNQYWRTHWERNAVPGFDAGYHRYQLEWTPGNIII
jgi:hypothetical protein